jgi:uncharacterized alpha-E superfamily protein
VGKLLHAAASGKSPAALEPVLEIADSLMTYRRQHLVGLRWAGVLQLLLRDASNPRALAFQVNALREHADALRVDPKAASPEVEQGRLNALAEELCGLDLNELAVQHEQGNSAPLLESLNRWGTELAIISDEMTSRYFSHNVPRVS